MRKVNIKSPGTFLGVLKLYIYIYQVNYMGRSIQEWTK